MRHFIGGFGAGFLFGVLIDALIMASVKKNTTYGYFHFILYGVFGGLSAWGLLP